MSAKSSYRNNYLTILNVISCIAVVYLHANGCFWHYSTARYWATANIIENVCYFAVPVFFMCSGVTLIDYRKKYSTRIYFQKRIRKTVVPFVFWIENVCYFAVPVFFMCSGVTLIDYRKKYSTRIYFQKRIRKTVVPFVFWNLVGIVFSALTHGINLFHSPFTEWLDAIINSSLVRPYWFFIPLFAIYLMIPVISGIEEKSRLKIYTYWLQVSFIVQGILPFLCSVLNISYNYDLSSIAGGGYLFYPVLGYVLSKRSFTSRQSKLIYSFLCSVLNISYNYDLSSIAGGGYLFYPVLGYVLSKRSFTSRQSKLIYSLAFIGFVAQLTGTYVLSNQAGEIVSLFKGYLNFPCVLYSAGIFEFIKNVNWNSSKLKGITRAAVQISKYTFAIYLMHYFVLEVLYRLFSLNEYSIFYRLLIPAPVILICILLTVIIRKIPVLKKIVP